MIDKTKGIFTRGEFICDEINLFYYLRLINNKNNGNMHEDVC